MVFFIIDPPASNSASSPQGLQAGALSLQLGERWTLKFNIQSKIFNHLKIAKISQYNLFATKCDNVELVNNINCEG